jgi:hypothetical protein
MIAMEIILLGLSVQTVKLVPLHLVVAGIVVTSQRILTGLISGRWRSQLPLGFFAQCIRMMLDQAYVLFNFMGNGKCLSFAVNSRKRLDDDPYLLDVNFP